MITLTEALKMFLMQKEVDGISPQTLVFYRGKLELFIRHVGDKPVAKLTLQDGQEWVLHLQKRNKYDNHPFHKEQAQPISKATLRGYVRAIKVFAQYLYDEDFTPDNVFGKLKMPKDTKRVIEVLTDEEIRRIYDQINPTTRQGSRLFAMVTVLLDTGIRAGELLGIEIDDVDFKQGRIKVRGKGDKERLVPFGSTTAKALLKWINQYRGESPSNRVFVSLDGEELDRQAIIRMVKRVGENAGVPRLHAHLFRHTFGTKWLRGGGDLFTLQTVLGHSDLSVTKVYMHLAQKDMDAVHKTVSPVDKLGVGKKIKTR